MTKDVKLIQEAKSLPDVTLVEVYQITRQKRLDMDKQSALFKESEDVYKDELIARMREAKSGALASTKHMVRLNTKDVPTASDWGKIREYIVANGAWELMHARLTVTAIAERWEAGEEIPGVEHFEQYSVSVSKL